MTSAVSEIREKVACKPERLSKLVALTSSESVNPRSGPKTFDKNWNKGWGKSGR